MRKENTELWLKQAECFPTDRIASSATGFLWNPGQVRNSHAGCDQKPNQHRILPPTVANYRNSENTKTRKNKE